MTDAAHSKSAIAAGFEMECIAFPLPAYQTAPAPVLSTADVREPGVLRGGSRSPLRLRITGETLVPRPARDASRLLFPGLPNAEAPSKMVRVGRRMFCYGRRRGKETPTMAAAPTREQILEALHGVADPQSHRDILSLGWVADARAQDGAISLKLALPTTTGFSHREDIIRRTREAVEKLPGVRTVVIEVGAPAQAAKAASDKPPIEGVKHLVAV